jgi:hypothetical protein
MRAAALAAVLGLVSLGSAAADPWTDPNGNMTLNAPRGWTVRPQNMQGGTAVLAFTPSSDCYFLAIPNPASAGRSANAARNSTTPLPPTAWATALQAVPDLAEGGAATVTSQSVDTSGFWPVQRAVLQAGSRTVHGAVQIRPGMELRGFCAGGDASYDAILNSLGHPNDQTWQTEAAAAAPAPTPAPAPAQ